MMASLRMMVSILVLMEVKREGAVVSFASYAGQVFQSLF